MNLPVWKQERLRERIKRENRQIERAMENIKDNTPGVVKVRAHHFVQSLDRRFYSSGISPEVNFPLLCKYLNKVSFYDEGSVKEEWVRQDQSWSILSESDDVMEEIVEDADRKDIEIADPESYEMFIDQYVDFCEDNRGKFGANIEFLTTKGNWESLKKDGSSKDNSRLVDFINHWNDESRFSREALLFFIATGIPPILQDK